MTQIKVGQNTIDVNLGVIGTNGFGGHRDEDGQPLKVNPDLIKDPIVHRAKQLAAIEEASGRQDGWVYGGAVTGENDKNVREWAFKPGGVNTDLVAPRRAPYLGIGNLIGSMRPDVAEALDFDDADSIYIGSTWGGDNAESPRAIAPRSIFDVAQVANIILALPLNGAYSVRRVCFDQGSAVLTSSDDCFAFRRLADVLAPHGIECMIEALPELPGDLKWIGAMVRYANVNGRGLLSSRAGKPAYPVPKGARLVVLFDGMVVREERGAILPEDVKRVVEWAAGFGEPGLGAASLELLIGGPGHAKPVVDFATANGVL